MQSSDGSAVPGHGASSHFVYDRGLLLYGAKRDEILTLEDVRRYGIDSFADPDYVRIYGMPPGTWYGRGIRLIGRTAVECTRDELGDGIGRDIARIAERLPAGTHFTVIDPFAGSCNTLYWILHHLPTARGLAFELDEQISTLTRQNIAALDTKIELIGGDWMSLLSRVDVPPNSVVVVFVAPPWGTALDESTGLDLRRTTPPIVEIISRFSHRFSAHKMVFATQVYENVNADSLADVQRLLDWCELRTYDLNTAGRNHGLLLGTSGWRP
jgi:predicted RNA methylase